MFSSDIYLKLPDCIWNQLIIFCLIVPILHPNNRYFQRYEQEFEHLHLQRLWVGQIKILHWKESLQETKNLGWLSNIIMSPSVILTASFSDRQMKSKNYLTISCGLSGTTANETQVSLVAWVKENNCFDGIYL